jgi:hypothetical protein
MPSHSVEVGKYFLVALFASVKFLFSPFFALGLRLNYFESLISTTLGGIAGILCFGLIGELLSDYWVKIVVLFLRMFTGRTPMEARLHARRKFKWITRFIVKVKHRLGLVGIALLSPCLLSLPLGAIACMTFFSHRRKEVFIYLFISLAFWSFVLNTGAYFFRLSALFSKVSS